MKDHPTRTLLIVDSPAKKRTIANVVGSSPDIFSIEKNFLSWSPGASGCRVEESILSRYQIREGQLNNFKQLEKLAGHCDRVLLATDPDHEGEFTAYQIAEHLKTVNPSIHRPIFLTLAPESILEALQHSPQIDIRRTSVHHFRRLIDHLFKIAVTPLLREALYQDLAPGYPEALALQRLCRREAQLKGYRSAVRWNIAVDLLTKNGAVIPADLIEVNGHDFPGEAFRFSKASEARRHSTCIQEKTVRAAALHRENFVHHPPAPFNLSTLLEEAACRAGMDIDGVISTVRQLYEGINLGGRGTTGLISYFRTESTAVDDRVIQELREYIVNTYGVEYLLPVAARSPHKRRRRKPAFPEGIRPTHISSAYEPNKLKTYLSRDQFEIYRLIWKRFIASQMKSATGEKFTVDFEADEYRFRSRAESLIFRGFLQSWQPFSPSPAGEASTPFPIRIFRNIHLTEPLILQTIKIQEHTSPSAVRYMEGTLVNDLTAGRSGPGGKAEEIIRSLFEHRFVEKVDRYLAPTELGRAVNTLLEEYFPKLLTAHFTASLSKQVEKIESGKLSWQDAVQRFSHQLDKLPARPYTGDSAFRSKRILQEQEEELCEECSSPMMVKRGRFGEFLACSRYPACRYTKSLTTGVTCPEIGCRGTIVQRLSRKGKIFYGCSEYPGCSFALWDRPIDQPCPDCHYPLLAQSGNPHDGFYLQCPECHHKELLATAI